MERLSSKRHIWNTPDVAGKETVGAVVGENLQRLREQARLTQYEAAHLLARRGAQWHRSKIAAIEAGERPTVAIADVLLLAHTFNVELAELFEGDGDVELNQLVTLSRAMIRDIIRGMASLEGSKDWDPETRRDELLHLARIRTAGEGTRFGAKEADQKLARRLDVPVRAVTEIALELWGKTLTDERDERLDELLGELPLSERPARRGHITRELSQQIEDELRARGHLPDQQGRENEETEE